MENKAYFVPCLRKYIYSRKILLYLCGSLGHLSTSLRITRHLFIFCSFECFEKHQNIPGVLSIHLISNFQDNFNIYIVLKLNLCCFISLYSFVIQHVVKVVDSSLLSNPPPPLYLIESFS